MVVLAICNYFDHAICHLSSSLSSSNEAALYTGGLASGAAYGVASNLTKQGLKMLDGKQCHFSVGSLAADAVLGAGFGASEMHLSRK
jgi:hypothetical protein